MMLVMMLQIGGSLGSALFVSIDDDYDYDVGGGGDLTALEQLAIWRFILGIGAGGVFLSLYCHSSSSTRNGYFWPIFVVLYSLFRYPLAAVMSAENKEANRSHEEEDKKEQGKDYPGYAPTENDHACDDTINSFQRIALTFSTQGLGFISVPMLAYPMLELGLNTDVIWRVLLGVGALPGLLVLYLRLRAGNVRGCRRNGTETVVASRDEPVGDIDSVSRTSAIIRTESFELTTPNQRSEDEFNAESTLFCDVTSSESEEALVENSHLEDDVKHLEEQLDNQDDACKSDVSTSPIRGHSRSLWESIKAEPNLGRKFAGTAGTWFLFDVVFYGNTLFEPFVLEAAFGSHTSNSNGYELLQTAVRDSLVISLLSLPGYFITVFIIGRRTCVCACRSMRSFSSTRFGSAPCFPCDQSPAYIQMQGFFLMFILYSSIGLFWTSLSNNQSLLLVLYSGSFLFANYGPNTTTFLLPSVTYSEECRSTLNGMSAAAGKVGALVGASVFAPAADNWGVNIVMICCGCVSLVAWALTKMCLGQRK
ncbi:hypothetical protein ACHAW5_001327 [Stephanodiscus triporus]|uniref:Major facilitator superfamily (MFS) profile domain-containing protein n=1 Tax=Stephanodiscus triporus TaxID=2934178 RepID=A0ABD3Q2K5_9STRA